jgi:hypothetical protein
VREGKNKARRKGMHKNWFLFTQQENALPEKEGILYNSGA